MKHLYLILLALLLVGCYTQYAPVRYTTVTHAYVDPKTLDTTFTTAVYNDEQPYQYTAPDFGWYPWNYCPDWYVPEVYFGFYWRPWRFNTYRAHSFTPSRTYSSSINKGRIGVNNARAPQSFSASRGNSHVGRSSGYRGGGRR